LSPHDLNLYRLFQLPNGIRCLLIKDLNSAQSESRGKSAENGGYMANVSVSVNVGSFNDPLHRPGMAHFLEHMIFMGSEKYPDENAFNLLISENGGYSNAYTENEFTNYQFKLSFDHLHKAMDMKANLLAHPLLKKDCMEREIQAVDSEFQGNFPYDSVREELILK
jgi:secreted Zn-dependent insulinase-like peptidase